MVKTSRTWNNLFKDVIFEDPANSDLETMRTTSTVSGEIVPSGLRTAMLITVQTVTSTAAKIPNSPLSDRNSITLRNESDVNTVYIGISDVNDTTKGWPLEPLDYLNFDITDAIELWAVTSSGETADVKIMELA